MRDKHDKRAGSTSPRMAAPSGTRRPGDPRIGEEWEAHEEMHLQRLGRMDALYKKWKDETDRNGKSRRAAELFEALCREEAPLNKRRRDIKAKVVEAERDSTRREALFEAIRELLDWAPWPHYEEAERVVMAVTVLLDAGRTVASTEVSRRMEERWGDFLTESAAYAAKYATVIGEDMCGVLYLCRPVDDSVPVGWTWMYHSLEKAIRRGVARYTDGGIEMDIAAAEKILVPRERAGAEAVMRGVNAHGEPPGLSEWLAYVFKDGCTWAEATVSAYGAKAEVGAAYAELMAQGRAPDPDPGPDWPVGHEMD